MKERPIIVCTQLIPKILDGSKTNTRRLNGLKEINEEPDRWVQPYQLHVDRSVWTFRSNDGLIKTLRCPYGQVGDRLWVRETWKHLPDIETTNPDAPSPKLWYLADFNTKHNFCYPWKSPLFMPRWASRITLEITNIRVERLQEITKEDIIREGISYTTTPYQSIKTYNQSFTYNFLTLWDSLNPKYPCEANPFVWVIKFKKI